MRALLRLAVTATAATAVLGLASAPAAASPSKTYDRGSVDLPADWFPAATCADGSVIGLGFTVDFVEQVWFDDAGEAVRETKTMRYVGAFEHLGTGERSSAVRGARAVHVDLVEGTLSSSGNYRTMTVPGEGVLLKWAGREVYDLEDWSALKAAGPQFDELSPGGQDLVCGLFGLEGADG